LQQACHDIAVNVFVIFLHVWQLNDRLNFSRIQILQMLSSFSGSRLPKAGNPVAQEDVVSEHESEIDCPWNCGGLDSHNSSFSMPWIQLFKKVICNR
jgi:hypothetical protein